MVRPVVALLVVVVLTAACSTPGPPSIPPYEMRERLRDVALGDPADAVRARLGDLPVRKPGHPLAPFPTPYRVASLRAPDGDRIRVEVYVVAARPAEGCPDVQYDDRPVAYRNDRVVALDWDEIEWRWREWGGALAALRSLQDRFRCEPGASPGALDTSAPASYIPAPSNA